MILKAGRDGDGGCTPETRGAFGNFCHRQPLLHIKYLMKAWIYKWAVARPSMTGELWPTVSAATSPGSQTTASEATRPKLSGHGQWLPASLIPFCVFAPLSTLDQQQKVKYASQTYHKRCPRFSLAPLQLLCDNTFHSEHKQNSVLIFPCKAFPPLACLWISDKLKGSQLTFRYRRLSK